MDYSQEERINAHRISTALLSFANWDGEKLPVIAKLLGYYAPQLKADIQALYDYIDKLETELKEKE